MIIGNYLLISCLMILSALPSYNFPLKRALNPARVFLLITTIWSSCGLPTTLLTFLIASSERGNGASMISVLSLLDRSPILISDCLISGSSESILYFVSNLITSSSVVRFSIISVANLRDKDMTIRVVRGYLHG